MHAPAPRQLHSATNASYTSPISGVLAIGYRRKDPCNHILEGRGGHGLPAGFTVVGTPGTSHLAGIWVILHLSGKIW